MIIMLMTASTAIMAQEKPEATIAADIIPKRRFAEGMGYYALTAAISSALAPAVSVELVQGAGGPAMIFVAAGITAETCRASGTIWITWTPWA